VVADGHQPQQQQGLATTSMELAEFFPKSSKKEQILVGLHGWPLFFRASRGQQ
jgi:hypothetical protein